MRISNLVGLAMALTLGAGYAPSVVAQAGAEGHPGAVNVGKSALPDMLLWSFGDCDNQFPYFNSDEHKECVRVVRSEEARDARAYRVCETSNVRDREEVARCKATYKANKDRSAQSGYVPEKAGQHQAAPTPEELQRVHAIASAAVENDKAAARERALATQPAAASNEGGPREIVPEPEDEDGPSALVVALSIVAVVGGTLAFIQRRKQADVLSAR
ncbi:MAG TPA: hypothetical protein VMU96_13705 [Casimicrobiaceae bacterium]|nr:hypothetical protein [Casimicrobiaceae bacterium]